MFDRPTSPMARVFVVGLLAALTVLLWPAVASAHTDFESSTPADGEVVEGPLSTIVVNFTNPAEPAGDEFQLLDPAGSIRVPTSVDPTDGTSFVLSFDPPLTAGTYGFRWQVRAGDAHPIDGSFSFDVTEPVLPTTTAPAATVPSSSADAATTVAPTETTAPIDATPAAPVPTTAPPTTQPTDEGAVTLEAFLGDDTDAGGGGAAIGRVGRSLTFAGLIFGAGALAALVWVIRGRRDELLTQLSWVRLAGLVVMAGGFLEFAALQATMSSGVLEQLDTRAGVAAALKVVGGLAVLVGFHQRAGQIVAAPRSLSAAVTTENVAAARFGDVAGHRWAPTATAGPGLVGFAIVFASFWLDGHTVSKGPWFLHAAANTVHLGAAAVWGGGVIAMTAMAWMRRRSGERADLATMVVRFSTPATVSLIAVVGAGVAMAAMILDRPGDLFDTEWGKVLVAKTAVVAVAAAIGAYNHFRLRPALEQRPDDAALANELRVSLSVESVLFVSIVVITAWLVAAAT